MFQQVSPYAHLISGGKATVARMFVNMATGQRGLVCQYDVVCFDEIAGVSFDSKDGVNIMKGYMASGEFSRGKDSIRAEGGIVLVGNLDMDLDQAQRSAICWRRCRRTCETTRLSWIGCMRMRRDGNSRSSTRGEHLTDHFGLVSDFLSECFTRLADVRRASAFWTGASISVVRFPVATSRLFARR